MSRARDESPRGGAGRGRIPSSAPLIILGAALLPGLRAAEGEPSLERLLEINSAEVFGADGIEVGDGLRVKLDFKKDGLFNKLFQSRSGGGRGFISSRDEAKVHSTGQKLMDKADDVFSFIAIEGGTAVSRFELADDFAIKFRAKIPFVVPAGSLAVLVNQQDGRNFIQTSFFQDLLVVDGGRKRRKPPSHRHFALEPARWFDRTAEKGMPVEILYRENKVSISIEAKLDKKEKDKADRVEVVSQDGIEKPSSGKVVFSFNKLSFLIGNLSIEGKLNRSWAEGEIARLRKDGKLKLERERKRPEGSPGGLAAGEGRTAEKKKAGVDGPDPEAEDDL